MTPLEGIGAALITIALASWIWASGKEKFEEWWS